MSTNLATAFPARWMPLANRLGVIPFFGDIHNHCNISYGHGALDVALARAGQQLDFVSITGHADWPDMPVDDESVAHIVAFHVEGFAKLRAGWHDHYEILQAVNSADCIVFPGYEIHSSEYGDYTICYKSLEPQPLTLAPSPAELKKALSGVDAFAFPHHIGYRQGARGINWTAFDDALSPFVEMFSMHGQAENSTGARAYLHSMGPVDGASTMAAGLASGKIFGVVGNTDHHSGYPGSYGHGHMVVYAEDKSRDSIWNAMEARRTGAQTGDRIHLLGHMGTGICGDIIDADAQSFHIEAIAGGPIDSIDIMRNGTVANRITPALTPAPLADETETLLYIECGWGARGSVHDWTGDLDFQNASIIGVEPRFRGADVVSPVEGEDDHAPLPVLDISGQRLTFAFRAMANPNNLTPTTQGFMLRLAMADNARLCGHIGGFDLDMALASLREGALARNLGAIDTPAFRLHQLPHASEFTWGGTIDIAPVQKGETLYLRLRQENGQTAWSSPLFVK